MTTPTESRKDHEQLAAMIQDFQTNRMLLDGLLSCYNTFRFTGGVVPREPWALGAMTSYLRCPFAADCISTAGAERYQQLADTIMGLGEAITTGARPRSLLGRRDIADRFGRASSEIRVLANTLEPAALKALGHWATTTSAATDQLHAGRGGSA